MTPEELKQMMLAGALRGGEAAGSGIESLLGIGSAEAAGPANPAAGMAPGYNYKVNNGQIYDSANVKVSPESVQEHIKRNEEAIRKNEKNRGVAPAMVDFANTDLAAQNEAMKKLLGQLLRK